MKSSGKQSILISLMALATFIVGGDIFLSHVQAEDVAASAPAPALQVAQLIYAGDKEPMCFSYGFLESVAQETQIKVETQPRHVHLDKDDLSPYAMVILAGEKSFALSDTEREHLRHYMQQGGLVLASASCADSEWAASFRHEFSLIAPQGKLQILTPEHPLFSVGPYRIEIIAAKQDTDQPLMEGWIDGGRLRLVFSAVGLNDTDSAGGWCCCCGANEIRNARHILANLLVYTATR